MLVRESVEWGKGYWRAIRLQCSSDSSVRGKEEKGGLRLKWNFKVVSTRLSQSCYVEETLSLREGALHSRLLAVAFGKHGLCTQLRMDHGTWQVKPAISYVPSQ